MTFPWRQLPWLQNKEHPNLGRSSENDSADTQGFGRKMTEGQWITWGSQAVKHPVDINWLRFLLQWPSARVVSATEIPKLVWPCGHIGSLEPWPHPCAPNQHVLLSWATPEPPLTQTAQPSLQHPPLRANGPPQAPVSAPQDSDTAFSRCNDAGRAGLPQARIVSTAGPCIR